MPTGLHAYMLICLTMTYSAVNGMMHPVLNPSSWATPWRKRRKITANHGHIQNGVHGENHRVTGDLLMNEQR
jgi:hypothetical protein